MVMDLERNAPPKPHRGEFRREREDKRRSIANARKANKATAKARDSRQCRWPGCSCRRVQSTILESAHIVDLSLGGSDETSNLITVCQDVHRGPWSIHTKDKEVRPLTSAGADGLCEFYERNPETGVMEHIATEKYLGVSVAVGR